MADGLTIKVHGLDDTIKALRGVTRDINREQAKANREVGRKVADWGQRDARSSSPLHRHFADAIRGRGTGKSARISILGTGRNTGALGAFYGANRYRQNKWVGNRWDLGRPGEGPWVVGKQTIPDHIGEIGDDIADARMRALSNVFPEG